MQLAAPADFEAVGLLGLAHAQGDVLARLALEPLPEVARGDEFPFRAGERRIVDEPEHRHGRLVDGDRLEALRLDGVGESLADLDVGESRDGHDLARGRLRHFLP